MKGVFPGNPIATFALVLQLAFVSAALACPNNCNFQGTCDSNDVCRCDTGQLGSDCSLTASVVGYFSSGKNCFEWMSDSANVYVKFTRADPKRDFGVIFNPGDDGMTSVCSGARARCTDPPPLSASRWHLQWLLIMPGAFWVIDLVWKLSAYCVGRATIISADVLPSEDSGFVTTKLTMQMRRPFRYEPGSHVYINLPFVSLFQWHPFSISSSATSPSDPFTLHIRAEGTGSSWTRTLAVEVGRTLHMDAPASKMLSNACAFVRGPFRSRALPILSYPVIVLVAGGIGITPIISIFSRVQHLLANAEKGQGGFKMVHLVWICRAQQPLLNWFASEFLSAQSLDPPGTLSVELYCTSRHPPCAVAASYVPEIRIETLSAAAGLQTCSHSSVEMAGLALPNAVPRSDVARSLFPMKLELPRSNELSKFNSSNKLTLNFGRPDLSALCYKIASKLPALEVTVPNVAVVACGPSALCSAAQDAAERAGFQFHREGFQL